MLASGSRSTSQGEFMTTKDPREPRVYWIGRDTSFKIRAVWNMFPTEEIKNAYSVKDVQAVINLEAYQALQAELDVLKESFEAKHEYLVKLQKQIEILRRGVTNSLRGTTVEDIEGELEKTLAEADEVNSK